MWPTAGLRWTLTRRPAREATDAAAAEATAADAPAAGDDAPIVVESGVLVSDAAALRVTTEDLPASEVRLRAAEDAAEDALSKFDAAPLTGNYRGKAEAFRSALAAAEAELDEALATARSSTSGALADGPDADD